MMPVYTFYKTAQGQAHIHDEGYTINHLSPGLRVPWKLFLYTRAPKRTGWVLIWKRLLASDIFL